MRSIVTDRVAWSVSRSVTLVEYLSGNVRTSSIDSWKARERLPVRHN